MRYVPRLDREGVVEASRQNAALWAEPLGVLEHTDRNLAQLERAGPEMLRYVGLVDESGLLVASLKRYALALTDHGGRVIRAVGIGAVFTREDRRRRGLAEALIGEVLREAEDLGYGAGLLYSDIAPAYYAKQGFIELHAHDFELAAADLPATEPLELRTATPADDDWLLSAYEARWSAHRNVVRFVRSRATWRYFRWRNLIRGEYVLRDGGRDVGYLIAGVVDDARDLPHVEGRAGSLVLWVDEWAAPGLANDRVLSTVRALALREGAERISGWNDPTLQERGMRKSRSGAVGMIAPLGGWTLQQDLAFLSSFEHF